MIESWGIQRKPKAARYDREVLQAVRATTWDWNPGAVRRGEVIVIPPMTAEQRAAVPQRPVKEPEYTPHPLDITKEDLERWGYIGGCRR